MISKYEFCFSVLDFNGHNFNLIFAYTMSLEANLNINSHLKKPAYFALAPSLTMRNDLPSPKALISKSLDPRGALSYSCQQISFDLTKYDKYRMTTIDEKFEFELSKEIGVLLLNKILLWL